MSELTTSKCGQSEIVVQCLRTKKVTIHRGRFGTFADAYEHAAKLGYQLLSYTVISF